MPDPFDRLHDALVASAAASTAPPELDAGRSRRPGRRVGLLAVTAVLVGGTAVAATTPWNPQIGPERTRRAPSATLSRTPVPAEQRAALGVLRRPQTDHDRSTPTEDALRALGSPAAGLRVDSIRLLRTHDGSATLLMSTAGLGGSRELPDAQDALCVTETTSRSARRAAARSTVATSKGPVPAPIAVGGAQCGSFRDLLRGRLRSPTTGVVPDGVAAVRVRLTTGRVLTAPVRDNFYAFPLDISGAVDPRSAAGRATERRFRSINGRRVDWLDAGGRVVRKNDIAKALRRADQG